MSNQYPLWKYLLLVFVLIFSAIYALPNLYGEDPALQISGTRNAVLDDAAQDKLLKTFDEAGIDRKSVEFDSGRLLIRFHDTEEQLKAVEYAKAALGTNYIIALNLAPATPEWLESFNALPMYLGLDLRGGVHFLMEVDVEAAIQKSIDTYTTGLRALLREARIRYSTIRSQKQGVFIVLRNAGDREKA